MKPMKCFNSGKEKKPSKFKYFNFRGICHLLWQVSPINYSAHALIDTPLIDTLCDLFSNFSKILIKNTTKVENSP